MLPIALISFAYKSYKVPSLSEGPNCRENFERMKGSSNEIETLTLTTSSFLLSSQLNFEQRRKEKERERERERERGGRCYLLLLSISLLALSSIHPSSILLVPPKIASRASESSKFKRTKTVSGGLNWRERETE